VQLAFVNHYNNLNTNQGTIRIIDRYDALRCILFKFTLTSFFPDKNTKIGLLTFDFVNFQYHF